jgi:hypothetical protein
MLQGAGLARCGSTRPSSKGANSARALTQSWSPFFSSSTSPTAIVALLRSGAQFVPAHIPLAAVRMTSTDCSEGLLQLSLDGQPALKNEIGMSVRQGDQVEDRADPPRRSVRVTKEE